MAPRMYYAVDAAFKSSPSIEDLGETQGPGGPLAMVSLMGLAQQGGNKGMAVTTKRKLAADAFLSSLGTRGNAPESQGPEVAWDFSAYGMGGVQIE